MNDAISTYAEFSHRPTAEQAVRALKAAGFDDIEIEDLSHGMQTSTDNSDAPPKKIKRFSVAGAFLGAILGIGWGLLVFGIPVAVLNVPYGSVVMLIGLTLCIGIGAIVGMGELYVLSGRVTPDPSSALGHHAVGIRVGATSGPQAVRVREILYMFHEDAQPRTERWMRLRRWDRPIGT